MQLTMNESLNKNLFKLLAALAISYFIFCVAFTISVSRISGGVTRSSRPYDWRVSGVSTSGWMQPQATFIEPRVTSFNSIVEFNFDTVRPKEHGPAFVTFEQNGTKVEKVQISRVPVPIRSSSLAPIAVSLTCENPFIAEEGKSLCTKLHSVSIRPRFLLLFPTLNTILPILALVVLAGVLTSLAAKKRLSITFILIPSLAFAFILGTYSIEYWERSYWLALFYILTLGGYLLSSLLVKNEDSPVVTPSKKHFAIVGAIFLFALWIRISATDFGLPHLYHPDEGRKIKVATGIVTTGNLDPNYFRHPSFIPYTTALMGKISSLITGTIPKYHEILHLGRNVSATLGAASVLCVFALASLLYSPAVGILASALLAVAPLHVACSRYLKEDADLLFFLLLSIYLVCRFIRTPKNSLLITAGLIGGFASSVKYSGGLAGAFIILPLSLSLLPKKLGFHLPPFKHLLLPTCIALLCMVVGFLAITPYSVLSSEKFLKDLFYEGAHMTRGHTGAISAGAYFWTFHLAESVIPALTTPTSLVALMSLGFLLYRRKKEDLFILGTILLFYLPAEYVKAKPWPQPERYILPAIPFLAIALSVFVFEIIASQKRICAVKSERCKLFTPLLIVFLLATPTWYSIVHRNAVLHDTRGVATKWVSENIPDKSLIVTEWNYYSPYLPRHRYSVIELKAPQGRDILADFSLNKLKESKADYFITSSLFYERYLRQVKRGFKASLGYKEIFDTLTPLATFSNPRFAYGFHNPTIVVFKIPREPA